MQQSPSNPTAFGFSSLRRSKALAAVTKIELSIIFLNLALVSRSSKTSKTLSKLFSVRDLLRFSILERFSGPLKITRDLVSLLLLNEAGQDV